MPYQAQQWKDIVPCEVTWNSVVMGKTASNTGGGTHGGARWRLTTETREAFRDARGRNPHDRTIVGSTMEVQANLTGLSLEQMASLIPGASLSGGTDKKLVLGKAVGLSERENAQALILKPLGDDGEATADQTKWMTFSLSYPVPDFDVSFDLENQKVFPVMFHIFDNLSTGVWGEIGQSVT